MSSEEVFFEIQRCLVRCNYYDRLTNTAQGDFTTGRNFYCDRSQGLESQWNVFLADQDGYALRMDGVLQLTITQLDGVCPPPP